MSIERLSVLIAYVARLFFFYTLITVYVKQCHASLKFTKQLFGSTLSRDICMRVSNFVVIGGRRSILARKINMVNLAHTNVLGKNRHRPQKFG